MNLLSDLSKRSPLFAIIAILMLACSYLFKKLLDAKNDQLKEESDKNQQEQARNDQLTRMSENLMNLIQAKK